MDKAKLEECWARYKQKRDISAWEELIKEYAPLVKYIAGRLHINFYNKIEFDDLLGYGTLGLLDAIEKFDPGRGVKFETYASTRIRGAILDGVRSMDWVPQSVRNKSRELEKVYAELESKLGRSASDREVAEALNLEMSEFYRLLQEVSYTSLAYLEDWCSSDTQDSDPMKILDTVEDQAAEDPVENLAQEEIKNLLAEAIERLPEKERTVIALYYYDSLTLKEIGAVLGLSESRISQLHTKAILRLRGRLSRHKKKFL